MLENFTGLGDQHITEIFGDIQMTDIDSTLAERGSRYDSFAEHARITQNLKKAMADSPNWEKLSDDKREALEMLAHKLGRFLNSDPEYRVILRILL